MKTRRHAKILELIREKDIDTQEELLRCLREAGYDVTQATVSRDIKELRLIKTLSSEGRYHYSTGQESNPGVSTKFLTLFADSILSIEAAGNLLVVKCMTGMAQAVCASIDMLVGNKIMGSVAGDDTILIIMQNETAAIDMCEELKRIFKS